MHNCHQSTMLARPAFNPDKLYYYCNVSCYTFDDLSYEICVQNIAEDVIVKVFNLITRINESKSLVEHTHVIVSVILMVKVEIKSNME